KTVGPSSTMCSLSRTPASVSRSSRPAPPFGPGNGRLRGSSPPCVDQVEGVGDRGSSSPRPDNSSNREKPSQYCHLPSIVKALALIGSAAAAIAANRTAHSYALRL